jgi:hypothetical protein
MNEFLGNTRKVNFKEERKGLSTIVLTPTMVDLQHEPKMCQELV